MNAIQLFEFALRNAIRASIENYPNEKVYVLFDGEEEYTTCPEKNLGMVYKAEPNLKHICTVLNGERAEGSEWPPKA